ncbi:uncharacterized protein LOC135845397 isoform X2 [Planococcus citri]|uniref:uncharacterized protein LOC135845397 isoform X2 n=1 Tax=Planococcus citri TaxID=170843 RepID=UPI0031F8D9DE
MNMYSDGPKRRRTSSFAALYKTIIIETSQIDQVNSSTIEPSSREEIIKNYTSLCAAEIEQWKKKDSEVAFESRSKMRQVNPVLTWEDCKSCLSPEDIEFLNKKSSCDKLAEKLKKVVEASETVNCLLDKYDAKVNASVKETCASVGKMNKDFCNYLLNSDEGNDSLELNNDVNL